MEKEIIVDLKVDSKTAQKDIDKFNKSLSKTEAGIGSVGGAAGKSKKGLSSMGKGFRALGTAMKGMGIGAIIALFTGLAAALAKNQKVMDAVSIIMGTVSQIFTEVGNILVKVFENVTANSERFDALGKVMSGIMTLVITPFKLSFLAIKGAITGAQLAWEQSFFGGKDPEKIKLLTADLKDIKNQIIAAGEEAVYAGSSIVKNFGESISEVASIASEVVNEVSEINVEAIYESVEANVQLAKSAEAAMVRNQGLIEQYDRQAEQQRQIRDNDLINIDDRIAANDKLLETLIEQEKLMLKNAKLGVAAAASAYRLFGLEEDKLAMLSAQNEVLAIEAQIEGFMSEQKSNAISLEKEKMELELSNAEATAIRQDNQRKFNAEMKNDEIERINLMLENLEIEKKIETERLKTKRDSYQEGTQAFIDANNELLDYEQESSQQQAKLEKELDDGKKNRFKKMMGDIVSIVGANSKFGKAIAIVQALQDTYAGANKALAQGGIFGFIGAAAVIAGGIANVKQIAGTKTPKPPASLNARDTGGETATPAVSAPAVPSLPPQFNTIGASGTNQLADLLGNQPPVQAFVVSGDVTTAQELDRNIITSASIG